MPTDQQSPIEVTAFAWVPPFARGFVRDLRVRWALEEIGLSYRVRLIGGAGGTSFGPPRPENYLAEQPFGQLPVYKEGALCLFESGAIVLHIGGKDERLLPRDEPGRGRAIAWMMAALNSIEPQTFMLTVLTLFVADAPWSADARAAVTPFAAQRLAQLSASLGDKEWLEGSFSIGDLMMVDTLRAIPDQALVATHPNLAAYVSRGTARPAFRRAMEAQLADFIPDQAAA
ncbi:MAG TPA: glutathione S-transferase family protein [Acetobacteraceae bacterium]|nr:glutathione S-transferase family protein [Acetobacteraceae bacterium]